MGILIKSESNNHPGKYVTKHWHGLRQVCSPSHLSDGERFGGWRMSVWGFIWGLLLFLNWAGSVQLSPVYLLIFGGGRCRRWDFQCLLTLWSSFTQREMTEMLGMVCIRGKTYRSRGVIKGTDEAVGGRQLAWLCGTHCWPDKQLYNACMSLCKAQ